MSKKTRPQTFSLSELPRLTAIQWVILLAVMILSFCFLSWVRTPSRIINAAVFTLVPLLAFLLIQRDTLKVLIRRPSGRDIGIGIGYGFLSLLFSLVLALLMQYLVHTGNVEANTLYANITAHPAEMIITVVIQLFGEEMLTLIFFLFFAQVFGRCCKTQKGALIIAWIGSAIVFGLLHYPTYQNWLHVLLVIGGARLILSLAFLKSKNLITSYIAHLVDDFASVGILVLFTALSSLA